MDDPLYNQTSLIFPVVVRSGWYRGARKEDLSEQMGRWGRKTWPLMKDRIF